MKQKEYSILALISPNKEGETVLKEALYLQSTLQVKLVILNVIKEPGFFERNFQTEESEAAINDAKTELTNFVKKVVGKKIPKDIVLSVRAGNPVNVLLEKSKADRLEFILVDKSSNTYPGALSKDEINELVSLSRCPVLTVDKDFGVPEIKNIAIPIDIAQSTKKRLLWAKFLAKKHQAKITILSTLKADIDVNKSLALKNARKIQQSLWEHDLECDIKILKVYNQESHQVILDYMKEEKPELLIIRTHQESIFSNTNIGKFAAEIVHGSKLPVFAVNYTPNPVDSLFL
ncbi:universal stress protein [Draconibacterium sp. IB214405]|uniref:universal stress protein n=1 Tax=Draconibacterium sp. IB214405 TaxID=3097352 RepID=UPI002A0B246A|nr:universal stress protein [Draconibacterium sp. IB214405]MDX8339592.1 universal stress protein [Draconibacterium sp. IB214405]